MPAARQVWQYNCHQRAWTTHRKNLSHRNVPRRKAPGGCSIATLVVERTQMEAVATQGQNPQKDSRFGSLTRRPQMILYLDSSAIVKQYVDEAGSAEVREAVMRSDISGTSVI